jgi:hypothetical protein
MNKEQRVAFLMGRYIAIQLSKEELDELLYLINDADYHNPLQLKLKRAYVESSAIGTQERADWDTWYFTIVNSVKYCIQQASSPVRKYLF